MKKHSKIKTSSKKSAAAGPVLPDLVTAMMKLVERLEILERKTDQVLGRVSNMPSEMRRAVQEVLPSKPFQHAQTSHRPDQNVPQNHVQRERILYQAICADCRKRCEVPFKPSGDRPVYCPECFAIRKAGHIPQDPTAHVVVPQHLREIKTVSIIEVAKSVAAPKRKKTASKAARKPVKKGKK